MQKEKPQEDIKSTDEIIDKWFANHFHNSPASSDTAVYNLIYAAKEDLKKRLTETL